MARIELKPSDVIFDEEKHEYWLNGQQLQGITEPIKQMLHPDLYAGIPLSIIRKAGEYGKAVHHDIYDFDHNFINSGTVEVQDYISLCKAHGLVHEASEYTVTDGKHFSSNIDKIYRVSDDTVSIGDIKTYGVLTPEKQELARYQLSTYAWMLQLQNPKLKIDRLFILHIRNKVTASGKVEHIASIVFLNRVPSFICEELMECYLNGTAFMNPYDIPSDIASEGTHIRELIETKERVETELNDIKKRIYSTMETMDVKTWITDDGLRLTRKQPTQRSSFNLALFKQENPTIEFENYMKVSTVAGSLLITA